MNTRSLPPAGHCISSKAILGSFLRKENGQDLLKDWFPDRSVFWVNSGTAALTLSLKAISIDSSRRKVILPAYSCPSVLASVIKAGLQPVLCDVAPNGFQMDLDKLKTLIGSDTLALIAVHLFGIPENIIFLRELTEREDTVLIEDAAQAFGNKIIFNSSSLLNTHNVSLNSNQYLGSFGDIGILSFGRGKPLSVLGGGAVLINNERYREAIHVLYSSLSERNYTPSNPFYFLNFLMYSIFYSPNLYWIPQSIPWLKLGETIFSIDFEISRINPHALRIGQALIKEFEKIRKTRDRIAIAFKDRLDNICEASVYIPEWDNENISLLRFPIILKKREKRDQILFELKKRGLGATGMYPVPLNEQEGIPKELFRGENFPNAKHHSERILTLPLHEYVSIKDIDLICEVFKKNLMN